MNLITKSCIPLTFLLSLLALGTEAQAQSPQSPLVVTITVEGLSSDYLQLVSDQLVEGGLKRFLSEGVTLSRLDYGPGLDGAAAATLVYTGASPNVNGIPSALIYDLSTKLPKSALHDASMIGNFTDETFSPASIKVSTLGDELRMESDGKGRVYSIAPTSHTAIAGAGHAGNGAYWVNDMTANWASTAYYKDMPSAVKNRNYQNGLASRLDSMKWTPLLNMSLYPGVTEDQLKQPFRISYPRKDVQRVRNFLTSPLANSEVTDVAIDLLDETRLGTGPATDMLAIGYVIPTSATRTQIVDSYLRLDRDIARLLAGIDRIAGKGKSLVMLAGTPTSQGASADDKKWNIPAGLYSVKRALSLLGIQLMAVHGNGEWVLGYHDRNFYLNRNLIKDKGLSLQDFRQEVADFLGRMAGISDVVTIDDIIASRAGDNPQAVKRNTSLTHAGDVIIEVAPGWQIVDDGTGRASGAQRHTAVDIPAFFIAPEMKRLQIDAPVDARTLAPTVAKLLLIRAPNGASVTGLNIR